MKVSVKREDLLQFEDEFQFRFYRLLPDLLRFAQTDPTQNEHPQDASQLNSQVEQALADMTRKLSKSQSIDMVDLRAEECIKLIARSLSATFSKTIKKRLPKLILASPKSQNHLIPFYLRFAAIIGQYYPEVTAELTRLIESEFREPYDPHDPTLSESRIKNIRQVSELTKFCLVPPHFALECLKKLTDTFVGTNIELTAHLLETAGPYLLKTEEVAAKFNNLLDLIWRLKEKDILPNNLNVCIEEAFATCRPS